MPTLYLFNADGALVTDAPRGTRPIIPQTLIDQMLARFPGSLPYVSSEDLGADVVATIKDGVVTGITAKPEPPSLYIHHTITGAFTDGPEGTPSVAAGETIQINLSVQQSPDPASPVVDNFSSWLRVPYRINNNEKRFRRVQFVGGQATISFTPQANHWGNMSVNEADFVEVGGVQIKLAEPISIDIDEL
jgi:hypothetical protein